MKFNGVTVNYDDLHVWNMADKNVAGKPHMLESFMNAFPKANVLQITQYSADSYLYTTFWFVDESKEKKKKKKENNDEHRGNKGDAG